MMNKMNSDWNEPDDSSSSVVNKGGEETTGSSHSSSVFSSEMNGRNVRLAKCTLQMMDDNLGCENSSKTSNGLNSSEVNLDLELKQPNKPEPKFNWVGISFEKEDPNVEIIDLTLSLPGNEGIEKKEEFDTKYASSEGTETSRGRDVAELVDSSKKFTFDLNLLPDLDGFVDVPIDPSIHSEVNDISDKVPLDFIPEDPLTQKNKIQDPVTKSSIFTEDEGGIVAKSSNLDSESVELHKKESNSAKDSKSDCLDTGFDSSKVNNEDEGGIDVKSSYSDLEAVEVNQQESNSAKDSKSNCLDTGFDLPKLNNEDEGRINVKSLYSDLKSVELDQKEWNSAKDSKNDDLDAGFDSPKFITEDEGGIVEKSSNSDMESAELNQKESNLAKDSKSVYFDAGYDLTNVNSNENNVGVDETSDEVESHEDIEEDEEVTEQVSYDDKSDDYGDCDGDDEQRDCDGDDEQREESGLLDKEAENSTDVEDPMEEHVPNTEECTEKRELGVVIKAEYKHPFDRDGPATTSKTKHESGMEKCVNNDIVETTVEGNHGGDFTRRVDSTINGDSTGRRCKRVQDNRVMEYNVGPNKSSYRKENHYRDGRTASFNGKEKFSDKSSRPYRGKGKFFNKSFRRGKPQTRWNRDKSNAERSHETRDTRNQVNQFGKRRSDYSWVRKDHNHNFSSPESAPEGSSSTIPPSRRQSKFARRGHTQPGIQIEDQNTRQVRPHGRYIERDVNFQTHREKSISPNIIQRSRSPYPFDFNPSLISLENPSPNVRRMDLHHNELAAGGRPHFTAQGYGVEYGLPQPAYPQMNRNFVERGNGSIRDRLGGYPNGDVGVERHHRVWSEQYGADFWGRRALTEPEGDSRDPIAETSGGRREYHTNAGWQSNGFGEYRAKRRRY